MSHATRRQWWVLAGLLALALLVRLFPLQREDLWLDEAYSLHLALQSPGQLIAETAVDNHPPLYYLLLHGWLAVFGASVLSARLFSIATGLLATAVAMSLAARVAPPADPASRRVVLFTGLLLALSPFWVYYSQEIRQYSLLGLCAVVAAWGVWRMRDEEPCPWLGATAFVLGSVAGLYTMYVGGLVVMGLAVSGLILCRRRRWLFPGALTLITLAFLPWLPVLHQQVSHLQKILAPSTSIVKLLMTPLVWVGGYTQTRQLALFGSPLAKVFLGATAVATLLVVVLALLNARRGETRSAAVLLLPPIVLPPVVLWLISQHKPMYLTYVLLPSGLLLMALAAVGLARVRRGAALLAALLAFFTLSLGLYWSSPWYGRGQTEKQLHDYLQANTRPGDVLLFQDEWLYLPARLYADLEDKPWPWPTYLLVPSHVAPASGMWPPVADGYDLKAVRAAATAHRAQRLVLVQMRDFEVIKLPQGIPVTHIEGTSQNHHAVISILEPNILSSGE